MEWNKKEKRVVHYFIIFHFRGRVPATSTELHGEALPGVWWLWREQAQLHSNLQWICELLGSLLLYHETATFASKKNEENLTQGRQRSLIYLYYLLIWSRFFFCRLIYWKNTWSSSWCRGSPALTWTHSLTFSCKRWHLNLSNEAVVFWLISVTN